MLRSLANLIGRKMYGGGLRPLLPKNAIDVEVIGLDTEYTSAERELLSVQFAWDGGATFVRTGSISAQSLAHWIWNSDPILYKRPLWIAAYWSIAELQHFDIRAAFTVKEFARGSLDVTYEVDGVKVIITDLARWYDGAPLRKVAEGMGEKKLEWNTKNVTRETLEQEGFEEYAKHDAVLAFRIATALRSSYLDDGVDIVRYSTPASASAAVFRTTLPNRLFNDSTAARRAAVYGAWGGRAEVFRRGHIGQHQEHDITGAYPSSAIAIGQFPVQGSWHQCVSLSCVLGDVGGFVHARFHFPKDTETPCLMAIDEKTKMAVYPLEGVCHATSYEIALAVEMGADVRIISAMGYKTGSTALADYMRECMEKRRESKGADRQKYKLGMNSLIGKFFQRSLRLPISVLFNLSKELGTPIDTLAKLSKHELMALAGVQESVNLGPVWMPEWAGLITGRTRAILGREIARRLPAYVHTDSIWVPGSAEPAPGWDNKGQGDATIVRTRYAALWCDPVPHVAHHSVHDRKHAEKVLREWDGCAIVSSRYGKSRPLHIREALRRHDTYGRWTEKSDPGYFHETDTRWDHKRVLLPSGHTRPWLSLQERQDTLERMGVLK